MANIKELKKKIKSTKGTLKITQAMKLVSASKLAKAQSAIVSSRPYAQELEDTIRVVSALVENYEHPFLKENKENKRAILLVISADKGLCGGYNSQLSKEVMNFISTSEYDLKVYFIGKKVRDLIKAKVNAGKTYTFRGATPSFKEISELSNELSDAFETNEIGKIFVAYNVFHSAMSFTPTVKQILPFSLNDEEKAKLNEEFPFDFKYEPTPKEILDHLIPKSYVTSVYTCLLDAIAAEHGSRMTSMDSAANNCKDAIRTLSIKMNKLRQAAITTELIEVVSGAESLNG